MLGRGVAAKVGRALMRLAFRARDGATVLPLARAAPLLTTPRATLPMMRTMATASLSPGREAFEFIMVRANFLSCLRLCGGSNDDDHADVFGACRITAGTTCRLRRWRWPIMPLLIHKAKIPRCSKS